MNIAALTAILNGDLDNAMVAATPGGIEAQEAAGQATFCVSSTLPIDCPRAQLEALGVKFGDPQDDLFVKVTLPAGWKKQATDHSMHSDLLDDQGRKRGSIFYKAAFYDRKADMYLTRRYGIDRYVRCDADGNPTSEDRSTRPTHFLTCVTDNGKSIQTFGVRPADKYLREDPQQEAARAWLKETYPDHDSVMAYWD